LTAKAWEWDTERKRYVYVETRRALSRRREMALRHELSESQHAWADDAAAQLRLGHWTIQKWEREARDRVKLVHLAEYMFGRGGKANMTPSDYGRVGRLIRTQYDYLHGFAGDIVNGSLSEARIADRLSKYFDAGTLAFERGRQEAYGSLILPCYPADGGTECLMRCKCRWQITQAKTQWTCRWRRSASESCPGCIAREGRYNPYIQRRPSN
jgi:hypothetical protein